MKTALKIKNILVGSVFKLLKGYAFLMLLTFSELFIGFLVLRVKYALLLGLLIAVIDISAGSRYRHRADTVGNSRAVI